MTQDPTAPETPDKITVCIEIDADGRISVGQEPEEGAESADTGAAAAPGGMMDLSQPQGDEESAENDYMQPVQSINEALSVARRLLQGNAGASSEQGAADSAFQSRRPAKTGFGA